MNSENANDKNVLVIEKDKQQTSVFKLDFELDELTLDVLPYVNYNY